MSEMAPFTLGDLELTDDEANSYMLSVDIHGQIQCLELWEAWDGMPAKVLATFEQSERIVSLRNEVDVAQRALLRAMETAYESGTPFSSFKRLQTIVQQRRGEPK